MKRKRATQIRARRGAVAVEFAFVAPVFVTILLGIAQANSLLSTKNTMSMAAREGARIAAMDHNQIVQGGSTTNAKIEADIRNFLKSAGLPYESEDVTVEIVDPDDPDIALNLDDPANDFKLFQVRIEIPYEEAGGYAIPGLGESSLAAEVVFRNAKASLIQ